MNAVETHDLTKDYRVGSLLKKKTRALERLSIQVGEGEVFGLIGPNGAGKTTTLKILMGIIFANEGTAQILGKPIEDRSVKSRIGYLPEHPYFYDYLTGRELLEYFGQLHAMSAGDRKARAEELLRRVELTAAADVQLRKYSKGMLQRLGIAQALLNRPEVVFLDEPMSGLDPMGRRDMTLLIHELNDDGATVVFSSHILHDVESLCDRVAILNRGKLVREGKLGEILDLSVRAIELLVKEVSEPLDKALTEMGRTVHQLGGAVKVELEREEDLEKALSAISTGGGRLVSVNAVKQSLEDYFIREVEAGGEQG